MTIAVEVQSPKQVALSAGDTDAVFTMVPVAELAIVALIMHPASPFAAIDMVEDRFPEPDAGCPPGQVHEVNVTPGGARSLTPVEPDALDVFPNFRVYVSEVNTPRL